MTIIELAQGLDGINTIVSFSLFLISWFSTRWSSSTISIFIWTLSNFLMELLGPVLLLESKSHLYIKYFWYVTWVIFNIVSIYLILFIHKKLNVRPDRYSQFVVLTYLLLSFLQVIRYADRFIFEWGITKSLYQYGILTLNFGVMLAMVCGFAVIMAKKKGFFK